MKTDVPTIGQSCQSMSLYPTFKEWKLQSGHRGRPLLPCVYILPLRNENTNMINNSCPLFIYVYILPLRNENEDDQKAITLVFKVYILPLRNENDDQKATIWRTIKVYILPLRNEN